MNTSVKKDLEFLIFSSVSDIFEGILIDSGATNSYIAKNFVLKYSLNLSELPEKIPLFILDSNESPALFITHYTIHKGSSGINPSASNDFSTSVNSVALVGELKTPFLPSSVHTPSIIPSQSLLPLRDEVFKEIKDVGEDVAISPLNLLQGDRDLPPLSFHASLKEQWDEEEQP
ncbi:hypothetical protein O181_054669 [Austropuccinia psidii MF-1]|uniref:Uncharacterized protein n=1 Tax=Austropuccinia psidii MF-1 TaxID=1389203 RepID=A0A9Q3E522_9BASI|nr:hypothetical protein [Austropuccinia psidii MF-1]